MLLLAAMVSGGENSARHRFVKANNRSVRFSISIPLLLLCVVMVAQASDRPVLFFSDITSGPATGNSDTTYLSDGGVYVTLYGNFLGSEQGESMVTLGGQNCLRVITWGGKWLWYQRIVVQFGSKCMSGDFIVTTKDGTSNGIPFTVRPGKIYYVAQFHDLPLARSCSRHCHCTTATNPVGAIGALEELD